MVFSKWSKFENHDFTFTYGFPISFRDVLIFILYVWVFACMHKWSLCKPGDYKYQKRVLDPHGTSHREVMSHHVGADF